MLSLLARHAALAIALLFAIAALVLPSVAAAGDNCSPAQPPASATGGHMQKRLRSP